MNTVWKKIEQLAVHLYGNCNSDGNTNGIRVDGVYRQAVANDNIAQYGTFPIRSAALCITSLAGN